MSRLGSDDRTYRVFTRKWWTLNGKELVPAVYGRKNTLTRGCTLAEARQACADWFRERYGDEFTYRRGLKSHLGLRAEFEAE